MKTHHMLPTAALALALTACTVSSSDDNEQVSAETSETAAADSDGFSDNFVSDDGYDTAEEGGQEEASVTDGKLSVALPDGLTQKMLGDRTTKMIAAQVLLDHSTHSPGVIDGLGGGNTERAISFYREDKGLKAGTGVDDELLSALYDDFGGDVFRTYTLTKKDVGGPFYKIPDDFEAMSKVDKLGYRDVQEMLGERFHMDQDFLTELNPGADFSKAGTKLVIASHGKRSFDGDIAKIEIRKKDATVVALDKAGKVLVSYPATIGSSQFPSPNGTMEVTAIAPEPNYTFDPDSQEWGPDKKFLLPPGPNNPVGSTWIDLGKNGYGIHGSPDPHKVAKTASHGCVRLTNWDAAQLARAIKAGTPVVFV